MMKHSNMGASGGHSYSNYHNLWWSENNFPESILSFSCGLQGQKPAHQACTADTLICWAILLASSSDICDSLCLSRNLVISPAFLAYNCSQILPFASIRSFIISPCLLPRFIHWQPSVSSYSWSLWPRTLEIPLCLNIYECICMSFAGRK